MPRVHIKKSDMVYVLSGKDRGKTGKVLKVFLDKSRAVVEGLNYIQKHTRPNPQKNVKGGILPKESPIHISNLMVVCKRCNKHSRAGINTMQDGRKVRVCKNCNELLDE
jgi:large subunit ribosomal protein L24